LGLNESIYVEPNKKRPATIKKLDVASGVGSKFILKKQIKMSCFCAHKTRDVKFIPKIPKKTIIKNY